MKFVHRLVLSLNLVVDYKSSRKRSGIEPMQKSFCAILILLSLLSSLSIADDYNWATSWSSAKNTMDDDAYFDHRYTVYCGCEYESKGNSYGSGTVDTAKCGLDVADIYASPAKRIEWEHIVPASLMPQGQFYCWQNESEIEACGFGEKKNRECCSEVSPIAKIMNLDLFNLAPAVGQLNQYRTNDPYGEVGDGIGYEGLGQRCEARDLGGTSSTANGIFEPPDCKKGDLARTWFYMRLRHGVYISAKQEKMFKEWSEKDPVSPWEKQGMIA